MKIRITQHKSHYIISYQINNFWIALASFYTKNDAEFIKSLLEENTQRVETYLTKNLKPR